MGNVIHANFSPKQTDGGKARIRRRRAGLRGAELIAACASSFRFRDDLTMDHADMAAALNALPTDVA